MSNKEKFLFWLEDYFFNPTSNIQLFICFALYPLSLLYTLVVLSKHLLKKTIKPKIPVVSIGNLTLGGSGKTPFLISLAKNYENIAVVLRGYGRDSTGLHVVTNNTDVRIGGDEAILYANLLPNAVIIVSEDRLKAINYAYELGVKALFLDDGFSKSFIEKYDILLRPDPEPRFSFTLPSGAYREPKFLYNSADLVVKENVNFQREVSIKNPTKRMILVTAISKPKRLDKYLPESLISKIYFIDHHMYTKKELQDLINKHSATSILTTQKDEVKMKKFDFPLSILSLEIKIDKDIEDKVNSFLTNFR